MIVINISNINWEGGNDLHSPSSTKDRLILKGSFKLQGRPSKSEENVSSFQATPNGHDTYLEVLRPYPTPHSTERLHVVAVIIKGVTKAIYRKIRKNWTDIIPSRATLFLKRQKWKSGQVRYHLRHQVQWLWPNLFEGNGEKTETKPKKKKPWELQRTCLSQRWNIWKIADMSSVWMMSPSSIARLGASRDE